MRYEFDWDPAKAASNLAKHGVAFEDAIAVFHDPLALSRWMRITAPARSGGSPWVSVPTLGCYWWFIPMWSGLTIV
jgi:hypothetical protein